LTISARLVEMMSGKIWLESEPGKGSTFHFTARFGLHAAKSVESRSRPAPAAPGPKGRTTQELDILLVEDNPINRRLALHVLEKEGHRVVAAENGVAALEALEHKRFDLVLMDVQMPRMDGIETTAAIRSRERITGEHTAIVALTAYAMAGDRERCLKAGMDGYLIKPIRPAMLLEAIGRLPSSHVQAEPAPAEKKLILDRAELLDRVDGDIHLLGEITGMFLRECGPRMASVREAMENGNADRFAYDVHTLCGMFRNLSAVAAQEAAGKLEALDLKSEREKAVATYVLLEREVQALVAELGSPTDETRASLEAT
jgi:CheY-like chemotaxis protein/HPt (histidine-containing phosphotransfer) domain-containing protein